MLLDGYTEVNTSNLLAIVCVQISLLICVRDSKYTAWLLVYMFIRMDLPQKR